MRSHSARHEDVCWPAGRPPRAGWTQAQKKFEAAFGGAHAVRLRDLLHAAAATEIGGAAAAGE